ncbi:hypothetical protein LDO48_21830 [Pantoea agglomerans]|nr:hypothetical protein [Pantoea agglomerans]
MPVISALPPQRWRVPFCCRGSLAGVPLPQALDDAPLTQRHWLRDDVRQFDHAYKRVQAMQQRSTL